MLSTTERKKKNAVKKLLPSFNAEIKKYDEIYQMYCQNGYSKELCSSFAEAFVDNLKKPANDDVILAASLYNKIYDYKSADFYLDMLMEKKLGGDEKFRFCCEKLSTVSRLGHWRDAEDFRTENINFIQTYMDKKVSSAEQVDMYIALALVDCASKRYSDAFRLLNFGYKPKGKNDVKLLDILLTAVYIYAKSGDEANLNAAVSNARSCLKLFNGFDFEWSKAYFEKRIEDAANGLI